ncbi:MAG: hypothetical protein FWD31_00690 [Planctomycetaceae bacterium]|nr:hypothetical protein [Planctomycetaceae bacterium]
MTNNRFRTKIIYIVVIIALLVPLFVLGRPASVQKGDEGQVLLSGGFLADLRQKENIVDAQLGEIDPASNTMKLATFGMRGVALVLLWHKSLEYEKKFDWNNVVVTSKQITMLEPRFTTIWDFLGWRLAYNASRDQDDYRERYRWVIRGFEFLEDGIHYNAKAPFLYHKAGWTISQKIGISDEKVQYRQLFRQDDDFHVPRSTPSVEERDNWLFGIPLYHKSEELFLAREAAFLEDKAKGLLNDDQIKDFYSSDNKKRGIGNMARAIFYANSRMNRIHYADWYEQDGSFGEKAKENWRIAERYWDLFGDLVISTTIDDRKNPGEKRVIYLKEAAEAQAKIDALNAELLSLLAPRTKNDLYVERWNSLTDLQQGALVNVLKKTYSESYAAIREHLDETQPDWEEELTALRNSLIDDPDELAAYLIPEPIRKGARGMEQSDERDEVNMAQKSSRALEEVVSQASSTLVLTPAAIAGEIGSQENRQREAYEEYLVRLAENPELADDPDFPKVEPPTGAAMRAREIVQLLEDENYNHQLPNMFCDLTNYIHYGQQIEVEQTTEAVSANEAKFLARRAFHEDANIFLANEQYLLSMRIWSELLDNPRYEYLNNDLFRRDFLDFVDRFRHIIDRLDDSERGTLYPIDFPFAKIVRLEFENGMLAPLRDSLVYIRRSYANGEYGDVADRSLLLLRAWDGFMQGYEYLKYAPVQEYKDDAVEAFAMYVDSMQKTGRAFESNIPLLEFINNVMYYEPITREALRKTEQINLTEEPETLLAKLTDAACDWNLIVEQFPILKLPAGDYVDQTTMFSTTHLRNCHDHITMIVAVYMDTCRKLARPITTDFPLHKLLPPGVTAVDPATVTPVTVATATDVPADDVPVVDAPASDAEPGQQSATPPDDQ